jgi:hypothetical protein
MNFLCSFLHFYSGKISVIEKIVFTLHSEKGTDPFVTSLSEVSHSEFQQDNKILIINKFLDYV